MRRPSSPSGTLVACVLLVTASALGLAAVVPSAARAASCEKRGDTLLRVTREVVIARRGTPAAPVYVSCWRPTGHRTRIGGYAGGEKPPRLIRITRGWVAYVAESCSDGRYDIPVTCEPVVEWVRARDGHSRFAFVPVMAVTDLMLCDDLRLIGLGTGSRDSRQAFAIIGQRNKVLDDAPALDLHSLERRGGRATWTVGADRTGSTRCP